MTEKERDGNKQEKDGNRHRDREAEAQEMTNVRV